MRRRIPPLRSLVAFEATVRCGGVTAAADELGVTHGAVSKQLALLEDWFGRPLLDRSGSRPVALADAADFARCLRSCLDEIAEGSRRLSSGRPTRIQVVAPATFAMRWLVPRLAGFQARRPEVDVSVQTTHSTDDWRAFCSDLVIRRGPDEVPGWTGVPFLRERITLVGSPDFVRRLPRGSAEAVPEVALLCSDSRPMELERWLEAAGLARRALPRRVVFNHFYVALEAALNGMGLVAAPLPTVSADVRAGRLAVPFPEVVVPGPTYFAHYDPGGANPTHAAAFASWLSSEGRRSMEEPAGGEAGGG